jgi:hypothetical protein
MDQQIKNEIVDISPDVVQQKKIGETLINNPEYGLSGSEIGKTIQSTNFKHGVSGWRLGSNGVLEAKGAIIS